MLKKLCIFHSLHQHLPIEVNLEISPVRIKTGAPKNGGTLSSMRLWVRMKLMLLSGRDLVSLVQVPGLGSGTLCSGTGCQFAFISRCSLKRPKMKKNEEN